MEAAVEFLLVLQLVQNFIHHLDELQKSRHQHDQLPVRANSSAFQQEECANLQIPGQEVQHHFDDESEFIARGRNAFSSQPKGGIDLFPGVFEDRFQNSLLAAEVLHE